MSEVGSNRYRLYDLTVATDAELSLSPASSSAGSGEGDWRFEFGAVDTSSGRLVHDVADFVGDKRLKVRVDDRGVFFSHGDTRARWNPDRAEIRLEPGDEMSQRPAIMLERVVAPIAKIIELSRFVALHASAVVAGGGARIFIGDSGAGKSTTALELMRRGRPMLADDLVLVDAEAGEVLAATPTVRLFDLPDQVPEAIDDELAMPEREKFWYRLPERDTEIRSVPLEGIYSLEPDAKTGEPAVERVRGREATVRVVGQAFDLTDADGEWRTNRFRTLCGLARDVPVRRVVYAPDDRGEPAQVVALLDHLDGGAS